MSKMIHFKKPLTLKSNALKNCSAVAAIVLFSALFASAEKAALAPNLPRDVTTFLENAGRFELYSLQPRTVKEGSRDSFHQYKVLGKTPVTDEARKGIIAALEKGIDESHGKVGSCFKPRHGIRASDQHRTVDLLICFECLQLYVLEDQKQPTEVLITPSPKPALNAQLRKAKLPLAP